MKRYRHGGYGDHSAAEPYYTFQRECGEDFQNEEYHHIPMLMTPSQTSSVETDIPQSNNLDEILQRATGPSYNSAGVFPSSSQNMTIQDEIIQSLYLLVDIRNNKDRNKIEKTESVTLLFSKLQDLLQEALNHEPNPQIIDILEMVLHIVMKTSRNEMSASKSAISSCIDNDEKKKYSVKNISLPRFADIVGNSAAIKALYECTVARARLPASVFTGCRKAASSVLLYGPPGTGKSMLAKAAAGELAHYFNCTKETGDDDAICFISISPSTYLSKYQGESEGAIKKMFTTAREKGGSLTSKRPPSILFFDEIDCMAPSRGGSSTTTSTPDMASKRVLGEFLIQTNDLSNSNIIVIGATNRLTDLDPALLRRFDKKIEVGYMESKDRIQMISQALVGIEHNLLQNQINTVVEQTSEWSGADILLLCREAAMAPVRDFLSKGEAITQERDEAIVMRNVTLQDFQEAFGTIKPNGV